MLRGTTLRDSGIAGLSLISPNFARFAGIAAKGYDERKALKNIWNGDATPLDYRDIAEDIFDQLLSGGDD